MRTMITQTHHHSVLILLASFFLLGLGAATVIIHFFPMHPKTTSPITIDPLLFEQRMQEAQRLIEEGNFDEAISKYTDLLLPTTDYAIIHERLGSLAIKKRDFNGAILHAQQALQIDPKQASSYVIMGQAFSLLHKSDRALKCYENAIILAPDAHQAHYHLAREFMQQKKYEKALLHAHKALKLSPHNTLILLILGYIYSYIGDLEKAKNFFTQACNHSPELANAHYNLGNILKVDNQFAQAIPHLEKALELQPYYPDAHIALAHCHWALDNLTKAWPAYEKRWSLLNIEFPAQWDGSDIRGKKILLFSEQGLGDALQFVRYAKILKQKGAIVICRIQKPLKDLLSLCPYIDVLTTGKEKIEYDTYAALMSLPYILGTTHTTIPHEIPYLYADKKLIEHWKQRLAKDKNFKIGICWHVDQGHEKDKLPPAYRSIPLESFTPLASMPNVSFYSLQKFNGEEQIKKLPSHFKLITFTEDFDNSHGRFMDTAALIQNLDLIISADTSIIHLAAGLGKPVWTLLPYSADCRWGTGTTTPWYPTMRLFRQKKSDNWATSLTQVHEALKKITNL